MKFVLIFFVALLNLTRPAWAEPSGLHNLIRESLAQHPTLRAAVSQKAAAQAGLEVARWQFWPTPSLGVESVSTSDPAYQGGDTSVATLRLQQPLWTGGRLTGNLDKARARTGVAEADLQIQRQQLTLRVVQAWSDAASAHQRVQAYDRSRYVHARLLALVQRRVKEGASARADLALAESRLDSVDSDRAAVVVQRDSALDKLALLSGRPVSVDELELPKSTAPAFSAMVDASVDSLVRAARDQSPLLAKARAQVTAAEADVMVAKAALLPEVYLRMEQQVGSFSATGKSSQGRVFVGLSTALGAGMSSLSGVASAEALHAAALEDIQVQQLSVDEQVRSDVSLLTTSQRRSQSLERARESAGNVYESWERQFLAGRKQWQDVVNAARELAQTEVSLTDAVFAGQLTGWRLLVLTHGVDELLASPGR